jgi:hypothetical protein
MAFNTVNKRKVGQRSPGPLGTQPVPTGLTGNGALGYAYADKSALFLLAVNSFFGQKKFYESAEQGDERRSGVDAGVHHLASGFGQHAG